MAITRRGDIDGLRTLAIIPVVLYHASLGYFPGGFVGVDVFFVISGFLITTILHREISEGRFSIINFYDRRARRLFPALFVVLIFTSLASVLLLNTSELRQYGGSLIATVSFVSNFYFWKTSNYFAPSSDELPLLHSWSLAVEEQFYIFFPVALLLIFRFGGKRTLFLVTAFGLAASLALSVHLVETSPKAAFYLLPTRAWELLIGSAVALSPRYINRRRTAEVVAAAGVALIAFAIFTYDVTTPFPGLAAIPPCLGTAAIIFAGVNQRETIVARVLSTRPMVWVGRISYSLYLWHWPILVLTALYIGPEVSAATRLGCVAASIVLAWLSLRYVELPFQNAHGRGPLSRIDMWAPRRRVTIGMCILAVAALPGVLFITSDGLPSRLTPAARAAEKAQDDVNPRQKSCLVDEEAPVPDASLCTTGPRSPSAYDTVLWGDSHADAFAAGVLTAGERTGLTVRQVTKAGCLPLPKALITTADGKEIYKSCREFNNAVFADIVRDPAVKVVVLAGRWSQWTEGSERSRERLGSEHFLRLRGDKFGSVEKTRQVMEQELMQIVRELVAAHKHVVLLGQAPEYTFSPAGCISRVLLRSGDPAICSDPNPNETTERLRFSNTLLRRVAASVPNVTAILPSDVLCQGTACATTTGGRPIYRDDDHVNNLGARLVLRGVDIP